MPESKMDLLCRLGQIQSALAAPEAKALSDVLSDKMIGAERIRAILVKHGHRCGATTIKSHRAKMCVCYV